MIFVAGYASFFHENKQRYGYGRIYTLLKREEITVSEKIIRRIMREEGFIINSKRLRKYSSCQGEISPSVPNRIERNFPADQPNQNWLTDITEFEQVISGLQEGDSPLVPSDRGCHYRWSGWIERMGTAGLDRSMSQKGCSPDNAACEGLFGRFKNEMFHYQDWRCQTIRIH